MHGQVSLIVFQFRQEHSSSATFVICQLNPDLHYSNFDSLNVIQNHQYKSHQQLKPHGIISLGM